MCFSIRKAEIINRYYPIIKSCQESYFVTITIKAVKEDKLKSRIGGLLKGFKKINANNIIVKKKNLVNQIVLEFSPVYII